MDDIDYNSFLSIYQKRLNDAITQSIALEARVVFLTQKVSSLTQELETLKASKQRKKPEEFS